MLDKVMGELKLQSSGMMDANSTQQLGKLLGVEAIITGTLVETSGGQIEVNARLIKTETAQAIGAAQATVEKNWMGDAASAPQQAAEPVYQQAAKAAPRYSARGKYQYGFFDLFLAFGSPDMRLEFTNANGSISLDPTYNNNLGISNSVTASYRSVVFEKLKTEGFGPVAMRVGGFGNGALGADLELSYEKRNIAAQDTTWSLNGGAPGSFKFLTNDYATVKTFGISGDLLLRHPGKRVDPYIGIGLGLSLNSITLPYAKGYTQSSVFSKPVEDFGLGFMFRVPVGMRVKIADKTQLLAELRYELNSISFDRGISGESDKIVISGVKFLVGMGFDF